MTDEQQTNRPLPERPAGSVPLHNGGRRNRALIFGLAGICLLAVGAGAGAVGYGALHRDRAAFDPTMPTTPIAKLADGTQTELAGKVVEIFGNRFVVDDGTGRALVETGRAGEGGRLVAANETVTVQGRFENGFLHAGALQRADGSVDELAPPPPPHPPRP
ncbi:hypothetical protein [Aureimonas leprariae]|uniref:hypothetical protein n=1 Tax=Plantimonas leprariae TaxID=2615207 RepID=UPI001FE4A6A4|nr:hypothetical protein [Aureimonas leprariae]